MKPSKVARHMIFAICILSLVLVVGSAIYYRSLSFAPFALGVFLGAVLNVIKLLMLEHSVDKAFDLDAKIAAGYMSAQYVIRLLMTGAVLVLGAVADFISLWGVMAGILTLPIAAVSTRFLPEDNENQERR